MLIICEEVVLGLRQYRAFGMIPILLVGLVGCGNDNNETADVGGRTGARQVGYYSNENNGDNGGNAILLDGADNDGPITEMMDQSLGADRNTNQQFSRVNNDTNNNNQVNRVSPFTYPDSDIAGYNINSSTGESLMGGSDRNYHGHLNRSNDGTRQSNNNRNNGNTNERITQLVENVKNVKEAKTVIHGDKVLVGVRLNNNDREEDTRRDIQEAVQSHLNGRRLHILTNENQFSELRTIDNDLRNGGARGNLNRDINHLIQMNNNKR